MQRQGQRQRPDPPLPQVFSRMQARAAGLTDRQITHRVATGRWCRVGRGFMAVAPAAGNDRDGDDAAGHRRLLAAVASTDRVVIVAGAHAARLHGLPRPLDGWGEPLLLSQDGPTRARAGARIMVAPYDATEMVVISGLVATSVARTVADCLRWLPARDGLAMADAAARRLVPVAAIRRAVERAAWWPGVVAARRLADLADGRRETPLESWSALAFADHDLAPPVWQVELEDEHGFIGRADAWWATGLVGEADGRAKYALAAAERGGADARHLAEVLHAERARENRIRRAGADVVRWGAADVLVATRAEQLCTFLRDQLRRRRRFTGTARAAAVMLPFGTSTSLSDPV